MDLSLRANPNDNYNILHDIVTSSIQNSIPEKMVKFDRYKHKKSSWITNGILTSIRTRDGYLRDLRTLRNNNLDPNNLEYPDLNDRLKLFNVALKKVIRAAKKLYYHDFFEENKSNLKETWQKIRELIGKDNANKSKNNENNIFIVNGLTLTNHSDIANAFNKYFASIGYNLASSIQCSHDGSYKEYLNKQIDSRFIFSILSESEVLEITKNLNPKRSSGHDNISTNLLIQIIRPILSPITSILNQCIISGVFPSLLKKSQSNSSIQER